MDAIAQTDIDDNGDAIAHICQNYLTKRWNAVIGTMRARKNQILNRDRSSTRLQEAQTVTGNIPHLPAKACSV
jgi:5S rRNA maturation endonuclease (ribonuclease M5)